MLTQLSIRDVVLIERLDLALDGGLNVLTGETGAGKSILLDALQVALGRKSDRASVRQGATSGAVTAVFEPDSSHAAFALLAENGIEAEGELILRRTVAADGKSRAFINDQAVGAALLREIGDTLVELHGQNDGRGLLSASAHRALLDAFGGHAKEAGATATAYAAWRTTENEAAEFARALEAARADADYLQAAVSELSKLAPEEGEEERLAQERALLMSSEKLAGELSAVTELLGGGDKAVDTRLIAASRRIERLRPQAMGRLDAAGEALERAVLEATEARAQAEAALEAMNFDPRKLEQIEERLFALRGAARKFKVQVHDLAKLSAELADKVQAMADAEVRSRKLAKAEAAARAAFVEAAGALTAKRKVSAGKLEAAVTRELKPLKFDKAKFTVALTPVAVEQGTAAGLDAVEFQIATNPGVPAGALTKIASGGELARVILALKVALAERGTAPTLIFDEVDQGVGGAVADAVGARLAKLGRQAQVLVVTHSPQVAARGDRHFRIAKKTAGGVTLTGVTALDDTGRREEIARMLSGASITDEARAAAETLLAARD
ncbi:DNA repair protein RecN [Alphaproteobacteria bacterium SO-S41]|nr:DNA repair protein RecN [Alphaproteobacteria bacterium SO-S41]